MSSSNSVSKSFSVASTKYETRSLKGNFRLVASRYTPTSEFQDDAEREGNNKSATAFTLPSYILVLVQGAEFPKEHWEPVISRLFDIQSDMQYASIATGVPTPIPIREVWGLDYINGEELDTLDYANALKAFQKDIFGGKLTENYTETDKFVLVAHSVGCLEAVLSTTDFDSVSLLKTTNYSLILSEPVFLQHSETSPTRAKGFTESAAAYVQLSNAQKAYRRSISDSKRAMSQLRQIGGLVPVHAIFGSIDDVLSSKDKEYLVQPQQGFTMATVSRVEGVGHWIPQSSPQKMAEALFNLLHRFGGFQSMKSGNIDAILSKL
ncbi:hypothetical protein K435DRAFT_779531 [Dendrothele bispora CBS 962.96]|uniref:AB hydrolase-1 domain-containing protein n=1 Tax=Dendrothele bispora (strain CBS 962.96) TaxID=1314807 RepID=A0A4S8LWZ0_DENBC|nr:hypothetical protein K435DRAFT_779531 [Dendrothele bispora CBS 962.96]